MSFRILSALAVGGLAALVAPASQAGDLGGYPPPVEYSGRDYYEPPRRGDVVDRYDPRDEPPPASSYKDDPLPPPPRRAEAPRERCVPRREIEERLVSEGWRDFTDPEKRGGLGIFKARRPNGRLYELSVDRCSGEIVDARPLGGEYRPYASYRPYYGWERRHWGRRYW